MVGGVGGREVGRTTDILFTPDHFYPVSDKDHTPPTGGLRKRRGGKKGEGGRCADHQKKLLSFAVFAGSTAGTIAKVEDQGQLLITYTFGLAFSY